MVCFYLRVIVWHWPFSCKISDTLRHGENLDVKMPKPAHWIASTALLSTCFSFSGDFKMHLHLLHVRLLWKSFPAGLTRLVRQSGRNESFKAWGSRSSKETDYSLFQEDKQMYKSHRKKNQTPLLCIIIFRERNVVLSIRYLCIHDFNMRLVYILTLIFVSLTHLLACTIHERGEIRTLRYTLLFDFPLINSLLSLPFFATKTLYYM